MRKTIFAAVLAAALAAEPSLLMAAPGDPEPSQTAMPESNSTSSQSVVDSRNAVISISNTPINYTPTTPTPFPSSTPTAASSPTVYYSSSYRLPIGMNYSYERNDKGRVTRVTSSRKDGTIFSITDYVLGTSKPEKVIYYTEDGVHIDHQDIYAYDPPAVQSNSKLVSVETQYMNEAGITMILELNKVTATGETEWKSITQFKDGLTESHTMLLSDGSLVYRSLYETKDGVSKLKATQWFTNGDVVRTDVYSDAEPVLRAKSENVRVYEYEEGDAKIVLQVGNDGVVTSAIRFEGDVETRYADVHSMSPDAVMQAGEVLIKDLNGKLIVGKIAETKTLVRSQEPAPISKILLQGAVGATPETAILESEPSVVTPRPLAALDASPAQKQVITDVDGERIEFYDLKGRITKVIKYPVNGSLATTTYNKYNDTTDALEKSVVYRAGGAKIRETEFEENGQFKSAAFFIYKSENWQADYRFKAFADGSASLEAEDGKNDFEGAAFDLNSKELSWADPNDETRSAIVNFEGDFLAGSGILKTYTYQDATHRYVVSFGDDGLIKATEIYSEGVKSLQRYHNEIVDGLLHITPVGLEIE